MRTACRMRWGDRTGRTQTRHASESCAMDAIPHTHTLHAAHAHAHTRTTYTTTLHPSKSSHPCVGVAQTKPREREQARTQHPTYRRGRNAPFPKRTVGREREKRKKKEKDERGRKEKRGRRNTSIPTVSNCSAECTPSVEDTLV